MDVHIVYWIMVALAAIPIPLLLAAWYRSFSSPGVVGIIRLILLIVATGSHLWLILAMWVPMFLGDSYSNVRFAIIDVNFVMMLGCSIWALLSKGNGRVMLGIAGCLTTLLWSLVGAVNSVV